MKLLVAALAATVVAATPSLAQPSREQALHELDEPSVEARRRAVETLAEVGTMADVGALTQALRDADSDVRASAEAAMWQIWSRSGDDEVDRLLAIGVEQMNARAGDAAVETFSRIIQRKPEFAEGWNKRATVYYLLGQYEKSLADCREVMKRNPFHFGALSGSGMNYLHLRRPEEALAAFERALAINPNLESLRQNLQLLRQLLIQQRKDTS